MSPSSVGSPSHIAGYATGSLGVGVIATIPSVLLLYFCTDNIGISPFAATIVILLPKLWALLWDPFVGKSVRRSRRPLRPRRSLHAARLDP